jgi:hypothetical protein
MDMSGRLTIQLRDRWGALALDQRQHNRIVSSGRRLVADLFAGHTAGLPRTPVSVMAVGTGNREPLDTDTVLVAQRGTPAPITNVSISDVTDPQGIARVRVQLTAKYNFGEANDPATPLREAGLLNDAGVLYSRVVFKDVTKTDTFELTLLWEIIF